VERKDEGVKCVRLLVYPNSISFFGTQGSYITRLLGRWSLEYALPSNLFSRHPSLVSGTTQLETERLDICAANGGIPHEDEHLTLGTRAT
jgi:hypothetical protein